MRFLLRGRLARYRAAAVVAALMLTMVGCCLLPSNARADSSQGRDSLSVDGGTSYTDGQEIDIHDDRCLRLTVAEKSGAQHVRILPAQQDSHFESRIQYLDVCDVRIDADGAAAPLDEALRDGLISLEEIFAYAQTDARNGFCQDYAKTRNGLNFLVYRYPEYDLWLTYDFTYTPDGRTQLIHELYVSKPNKDSGGGAAAAAQEDWGLTFEVMEADDSSITLNCTQSGGQQLGVLIADFYYIDPAEGGSEFPRLECDVGAYQPKPVLPRDTSTQIVLDWTDTYGPLQPGDYVMTLKVNDVYDAEGDQTGMSKFQSRQSYLIGFSIP